MSEIHESHDMKCDDEGPFFCRACGTFAENCINECEPVPEEERFWNGSFDELIEGMLGLKVSED